jgi:hypothetical protein
LVKREEKIAHEVLDHPPSKQPSQGQHIVPSTTHFRERATREIHEAGHSGTGDDPLSDIVCAKSESIAVSISYDGEAEC